MNIKELQKEIHDNATAHGWHEEERTFGEEIALCHSELSEALEEYRNCRKVREIYHPHEDDHYEQIGNTPVLVSGSNKPEGIPIELADVVIRIMDMCERYGIDLEAAIIEKHKFNKTRSYKHGGKVI